MKLEKGIFSTISALTFLSLVPLTALGQALPDTVRMAGVTLDEWNAVQDEVNRAAAERGVSQLALAKVAERMGLALAKDGSIDLGELLDLIDSRATLIADLQSRLQVMQRVDDDDVRQLLTAASQAIADGDLDTADDLLQDAAEYDLAAIELIQDDLKKRQLRAGETIYSRGEIAFLEGQYLDAADKFVLAAQTVPASETTEISRYLTSRASALFERGRLFGDVDALQRSIQQHQAIINDLLNVENAPLKWANQHGLLGDVLRIYGERHNEAALEQSIDAYASALSAISPDLHPFEWAQQQLGLGVAIRVFSEHRLHYRISESEEAIKSALKYIDSQTEPERWALAQNELGTALRVRGDYGAPQYYSEAIEAFERALTVRTRSEHPREWAATTHNLGIVYSRYGRRGTIQQTQTAIDLFHAALEIRTKSTAPADWAMSQHNLGTAFANLGDETSMLASVEAIKNSLTVFTRDSAPNFWAIAKLNLGNSYSQIGGSDNTALAIQNFEDALLVFTKDTHANLWGGTKFNLGNLYLRLARQTDPLKVNDAIASYENAISSDGIDLEMKAEAHYNLALAYELVGNEKVAIQNALTAATLFLMQGNSEWWSRTQRLIVRLGAE